MSAADGRITFDTKINTKGIKDGMKGAEAQVKEGSKEICTHFDSIGNSLKKLGAMIGSVFAIRELVRFGKEAIQLASDLQEVQNVVDVTFGDMSEAVNEFARNAIEQFGLSELSAKQYSSTMGSMLKSMGFSTKQAAEMSMTLTGLAGDLASFYNLSGDEAFAKLRSGISGETEPLKQLGINLSVANLEQYALTQGMGKAYSAMTQQEQALLRYNYLLSVTSDAQGDFARTADSWANQTRILTEQFNMLKASIGQGLINVFTPVLKVVNTVLSGLQRLATAFQQVTALIFGSSRQVTASAPASDLQEVAGGYNAAADGAEGLAKGTQAAGKAAKKAGEEAKKLLASFDEINKLTAPETGDSSTAAGSGGIGSIGGTGAAGLSIPAFESEPIEDTVSPQIQAIVDKIMAMIEPLRDIDFTRLKESLANLGDSFIELGGFILDGLEWVWFNLLVPLAKWTIEEAAPASIDLLSAAVDLLRSVGEALQPFAEWLIENFLKPLAEWTGDLFIDALKEVTDLLRDLSDVLQGNKSFGDFVSNLTPIQTALVGIASAMTAIAIANGAVAAGNGFKAITDFFANVTNLSAGGAIGKIAEVIAIVTTGAGSLNEAMTLVFGTVTTTVAGIGAAVVGAVIAVTNFLSMLNDGFSWVKEAFMLVGIAIGAVGAIILGVPAVVAGVVAAVVAAVATVVVLVVNYADQIKEGLNKFGEWLKNIFCRDWTQVFGPGLGTALNAFVGIVSGILGGLKEMFFGLLDFIQGVFTGNWSQAWEGIKGILKGAINGIIGIINGLIEATVNGVNAVFRLLSFDIPLPNGGSIGLSLPQFAAPQIPYLAQGAVIPPNAPFMAVLGDQRSGNNIEAPESLIRKIVREETRGMSSRRVEELLERLISTVEGIEIGDETIGRAAARYDKVASRARGY